MMARQKVREKDSPAKGPEVNHPDTVNPLCLLLFPLHSNPPETSFFSNFPTIFLYRHVFC
jgi:hypothetical protein